MTNNIIKLFIVIIISSIIIHFFSFKILLIVIGIIILAIIAMILIALIISWTKGEFDSYFEREIDPKIYKFINWFIKKK